MATESERLSNIVGSAMPELDGVTLPGVVEEERLLPQAETIELGATIGP